jgi:aromatic ring-cleaving dioxygenase
MPETQEPNLDAVLRSEEQPREEQELLFTSRHKKTVTAPIQMEFQDGWHALPGWLVENLGGAEMLSHPGTQAQLKAISYADFMTHWSEQNTRHTIGRVLAQVRTRALR